MSLIFFAKSSAAQKRQKHASEREKILAAAVKNSDDDASDDERNISVQNSLLNNDKSTAYDILQIEDIPSIQYWLSFIIK